MIMPKLDQPAAMQPNTHARSPVKMDRGQEQALRGAFNISHPPQKKEQNEADNE